MEKIYVIPGGTDFAAEVYKTPTANAEEIAYNGDFLVEAFWGDDYCENEVIGTCASVEEIIEAIKEKTKNESFAVEYNLCADGEAFVVFPNNCHYTISILGKEIELGDGSYGLGDGIVISRIKFKN